MGSSRRFGSSVSETTIARGEFVCPVERRDAIYEVRRSQRRFAVFGIGLRTGGGDTIRCTSCGTTFEPGSLSGPMDGAPPPPGPAASAPAIAPRVLGPEDRAAGPRRVPPPPPSPAAFPPPAPQLPPLPTAQPPEAPRATGGEPPRHADPPPRAARPEASPAPPAPRSRNDDRTRITTRSPRRQIRWILVSADDAVIELDGTTVVGRDPSSDLVTGSTAVPVVDVERSMSKSHAALIVTDDGLFVEDLHSTNGVRIVRGGEERELLRTGTRERLLDGDELLLGDHSFGVSARATQ